jgi:hypothetical protein
MTNDEREEEREFLDGLKARTQRDLPAWMDAITAQGFTDKNETIDWLRSQGFSFARASWLERIHSNGGRPIYAHAPALASSGAVAHGPRQAASGETEAPAKPARQARPDGEAAALEKLIAAAKGYQPLYHLLEAEIRKAIPALVLTPRPACISLGAPGEFAAIGPHATGLRLGLDLGERAFDAPLVKAKLKGVGAAITHMVVLTDARQVNHDLLSLLRTANNRVNL